MHKRRVQHNFSVKESRSRTDTKKYDNCKNDVVENVK